jgi:hypothetical protein
MDYCSFMTIPFEVNNATVRQDFLRRTMMEALNALSEKARPLWGAFTAQQMIEHLLWTFEFSTDDINVHRDVPPLVAERMRKFLYDDRPTPRDFMNPLLAEGVPPLRFNTFREAKAALGKSVDRFFDLYRKHPDVIHSHPLFGPLGGEEWERALFKHCYHHLMQFGIIEAGNRV